MSASPREVWSIGIYEGAGPLDLAPLELGRNPVLSAGDVSHYPADFVADPFMVREDGRWLMFFEVWSDARARGVVGLATSSDGLDWRYGGVVLEETFHLSYPHVFKLGSDYYMVPETLEPRAVRLYRAHSFPRGWTFERTLLEHPRAADPTLLFASGLWWLFLCATPYKNDTLCLFFSESLEGPWYEHAASPVVSGDRSRARPAGRIVFWQGRLLRFAQDCSQDYGRAVRAFEIEELTPDVYAERPTSSPIVLAPGRESWNRWGMHHLDAHEAESGRWIACVDGKNVDNWTAEPP